jgi:hypothetical protein
MLDRANLENSLNLISAILEYNSPEVTDFMIDFYMDKIEEISEVLFDKVITYFYDSKKFPTPSDFLEFETRQALDTEWFSIMAVVSGSQKSALISDAAARALVTIASSHSVLGALLKFAQIKQDDHFTTREYRKQWEKQCLLPAGVNAIAAAKVLITLEVSANPVAGDGECDKSFNARTAAMIRCIKEKKSVSIAWMGIISKFPIEKQEQVMLVVSQNNFTVAEVAGRFSNLRAMANFVNQFDEAAINKEIAICRELAGVNN